MRKLAEDPRREYNVRRIRTEDLDAVLELQRRSFVHPWSAELFRREMTHDWSTILLAEERISRGEPRIVGFLIYWLVHDELHILNLATAPEHRRKGVARALLQATVESGRRHRCAMATLEVRRSNEGAIDLYRSFNFRAVGIRPNYYVDEGEDAIVMVCDL